MVAVRRDIVKRTTNTSFNLVFNANKLLQMMKCETLEEMKLLKGIGEKNMDFLPEFFAVMKPHDAEEEISIELVSQVAPPIEVIPAPVAPPVERKCSPQILKTLKKCSKFK